MGSDVSLPRASLCVPSPQAERDGASHCDDDLAEVLPARNVLVGFSSLAESEHSVDHWSQLRRGQRSVERFEHATRANVDPGDTDRLAEDSASIDRAARTGEN